MSDFRRPSDGGTRYRAVADEHGEVDARRSRDALISPYCRSEPRQPHNEYPVQRTIAAERVGDWRCAAKILIMDDCTLQRENLAAILGKNGRFSPTMAWDAASAAEALREIEPDVVLLSMTTRDKLKLLSFVRETCATAKVIVVGISEDDESDIIACAEAGVAGYHLRTESLYELTTLIAKVIEGESACSPMVSTILLRHLSVTATQRRSGSRELALTTREMQILRMLEMGLSNRDIADQLCIALHTVKNHVHAVLGKLGVGTRAEAAAYSRSLH